MLVYESQGTNKEVRRQLTCMTITLISLIPKVQPSILPSASLSRPQTVTSRKEQELLTLLKSEALKQIGTAEVVKRKSLMRDIEALPKIASTSLLDPPPPSEKTNDKNLPNEKGSIT